MWVDGRMEVLIVSAEMRTFVKTITDSSSAEWCEKLSFTPVSIPAEAQPTIQ
jgi:hypothetical protein